MQQKKPGEEISECDNLVAWKRRCSSPHKGNRSG